MCLCLFTSRLETFKWTVCLNWHGIPKNRNIFWHLSSLHFSAKRLFSFASGQKRECLTRSIVVEVSPNESGMILLWWCLSVRKEINWRLEACQTHSFGTEAVLFQLTFFVLLKLWLEWRHVHHHVVWEPEHLVQAWPNGHHHHLHQVGVLSSKLLSNPCLLGQELVNVTHLCCLHWICFILNCVLSLPTIWNTQHGYARHKHRNLGSMEGMFQRNPALLAYVCN